MTDIGGLYGTHKVGDKEVNIVRKGSNLDLDMTDFITLMITQLTNQGIDNTMDTSEMLNQMVQMQMITSMVNMTDAVTMNYSASLVGKYVTVGKLGEDGKLQEVYGEVTGTGTMGGQQVIFIDDGEYYYLSDIMAVGKLPPPKEDTEPDEGKDPDGAGDVEKPGETEKPGEGSGDVDDNKPVEDPDETTEDTNKDEPDDTVDKSEGTEGA